MFEVKIQTYWSDVDAAGMVYFAHFFRFVEQAEDEIYRAAGVHRESLLRENRVGMPRGEAYVKFLTPIHLGSAIRVRLNPHFKGQKTIRYEFEILADATGEKHAEGYMTVVCVDTARFKATPIPDPVRAVIESAC